MATMWTSTAVPGARGHMERSSIQNRSCLAPAKCRGVEYNGRSGAGRSGEACEGWWMGRGSTQRDSKANRISTALLGKCALLVIAIQCLVLSPRPVSHCVSTGYLAAVGKNALSRGENTDYKTGPTNKRRQGCGLLGVGLDSQRQFGL